MTNPIAFGGGEDLERFKTILAEWRKSLVDLSGRNKLLNFRHTRSATLEIQYPPVGELVAGLDRGWRFAPLPEAEPDGTGDPEDRPNAVGTDPDGIVTQKTTAPALLRALTSLRGKSVQLFNDYGLWTLQLGVGMLRWREDGATTSSDAPLVLFPVRLERLADGRVRLVSNDDEDPRLNPALRVKLEQFHIDWSPVLEQDPADVDAVLDTVTAAVAGKTGWEVSRRVVVALFASHKESMYQDLLENEARILNSDLVRAVALGPEAGLAPDRFDFEEIDLDRIDELSPPEDSPLVLDADASQRQAVAAAVAGRSFVLDGPPGTGKSQTITNMIAGLMHAGRSVLFVSEKAAALDVVLDRLKSVGLDSYALALHSHNTSRRAVAQELGRALEEEPQAPRLSAQTVTSARQARTALSAYADAMNEISEPLGRSLHDVIGRVGRLSDAPVAYLAPNTGGAGKRPAFDPAALGAEDLRLVVEATHAIADAWQAVADPAFPWRDLRTGAPSPRPALEQAAAALSALSKGIARHQDLLPGGPIEDEETVTRLVNLLRLAEVRPEIPVRWLTEDDFADEVEGPVDAFTTELRTALRARSHARTAVGERWEELSPRLSPEPGPKEKALAALSPAGTDLSDLTAEQATDRAGAYERAAAGLDRAQRALEAVTRDFGLRTPRGVAAAEELRALVAEAGADHRPLARWLAPGGPAEAEEAAVRVTADALRAFFARRAEALAARERAAAEAGPGWTGLPPALTAQPPADEQALAGLRPAGLDLTPLTRARAAELAAWLSDLVALLEKTDPRASALAGLLGRGVPSGTREAEELIALADLASAPHRAPAHWLDPEVLPRVRAARAELADATRRLAKAEAAASAVFRPEVVTLPELPEVVGRLAEGARGIGGMLSGAVRADRKIISAFTIAGTWRADLYDQLPLALAWHAAHDLLRSLTRTHGALLGRYATPELPDLTVLEAALAHAEALHRLAPDTLADPGRRALLAGQLSDGRTPTPELTGHVAAVRGALADWRTALGGPHLADRADGLAGQPLGRAARWAGAHLAPLTGVVDLLDTVASAGRGDDDHTYAPTLEEARTALDAVREARRATDAFDEGAATDRLLLGPWYQGLDTEPARLAGPAPDGAPGQEAVGALLARARDLADRPDAPRAEERHHELLGRYASCDGPGTITLCRVLDTARTAERLAPDTLADPERRARLADRLADGRPVPHETLRQAEELGAELSAWRRQAALPHLAASGERLLELPFEDAARWLRAHVEPLEDAADLIRTVARVLDTDGSDPAPGLGRARRTVAAVAEAREAGTRFLSAEAAHRELLGALYQGTETDRSAVLDALDWARKARRTAHGVHAAPMPETAARTMLGAAADPSVAGLHQDWLRQRENLAECFEPQRAAAVRRELVRSLTAAEDLLTRLDADPYGPEAWISCAGALGRLKEYGLHELPGQLAQRDVSAADFPDAVERAVLTAWIERRLELDARLRPLRAVDRDQLVERFREADRALVEAAHAEVIAACNARRPRRTSVGQAAVLKRQAQLKKRHKPVRQLLDETGDVVRLIKPCFMMSPLTVSQFLPADFRFDVVIFDEASQVLPQDAVNSIYRGNALIVAGDQKQLPPTSFFSAGGDADDDEDEEGMDTFESVLDACKASGVLRDLPLRWHYRSRHENLIAFSNHEFYDGSMVTFPGALEEGPDVGVSFHKADGVYDRGGRSDNVGEAALVARRVIHHFATRPGLTLGVVALSKAQAEAIEEAVREARAARPDLDRFFTEDRLDGFFVKNLETVQGDERDVIVLSVGYGPNQQGRLLSTFGPINKEGGWRRLNVAVTRARRRMEVVASFHGGELGDSANKSVQHLKRYLQYAEHGPNTLQTAAPDPDAQPESPFEEEVLGILQGWGYDVQPQVGVAGFRIDMAVRHPRARGSYALGIECDGVMYHSSRAARDRDRLREAVLRDLGWQLHRIWGTDWYRNRRDALARLRAAVEAACAEDPHAARPAEPERTLPQDSDPDPEPAAAQTVSFVPVDAGPPDWSRPYRETPDAELLKVRIVSAKRRGVPGAELQNPDASGVVADVALCVIDTEGPVTEELIITRVRSAWDLGRAGAVVQDRVRRALRGLVSRGQAVAVDGAYDLPGREPDRARTPTRTVARKVGQVPSAERRIVVLHVVEESPGVDREELLREVARFFGWARLGSEIRDALTADVDGLVRSGTLQETTGGLVPAEAD
ncbi:DUF3320 domain-containing protein [Streptomyces termitum]|uniref:AAA domain-containing protein n=1 Tax=Streptomyces termitum TaxID=67368 RepID=A0A918T8T1_9ACTN|nr:DUF3320 domain-containing protein [Streptomyces termitum]GHB11205.1 hypothetical protein GCM10010305_62460 [Streptomyces termitum]